MSDLFDHADRLAKARVERDVGMAQAEGGATPEWSIFMLEMVKKVALCRPFFTSDEVFDMRNTHPGAPSTPDPRALGPVMKHAKQLGYCRNSGRFIPCYRRRMAPITVWESLICKS